MLKYRFLRYSSQFFSPSPRQYTRGRFTRIPGVRLMSHAHAVRCTLYAGVLSIIAATALSPVARAGTLYWDVDGSGNAGFGTITGTWDGANAFWNSDVAGGAGGSVTTTTTSADDLQIVGGTTGNITINGARAASSFTFNDNVAVT